MPDEPRKYPIDVGNRVRHMDGARVGEVIAMIVVAGLPGARVRWIDGDNKKIEDVALGYLQRLTGDAL